MQIKNQPLKWIVGLDWSMEGKCVWGSISHPDAGPFGNVRGWRTRSIGAYVKLQTCVFFSCSPAKMNDNSIHLCDAHWSLRYFYKYNTSLNRINLFWFLQWKNVILECQDYCNGNTKNLSSSPSFVTTCVFRPDT